MHVWNFRGYNILHAIHVKSFTDHDTQQPGPRHQQFRRRAVMPHTNYQDIIANKINRDASPTRGRALLTAFHLHRIQDLLGYLTLHRNHTLHRRPTSLFVQHIHLPTIFGGRRQRGQRYAGLSTEHDVIRGRAVPFGKRSIPAEPPALTLSILGVSPVVLNHGIQSTHHLMNHLFACTIRPRRFYD